MSEPASQITREELDALARNFREVRHAINNHIAVIMALGELSRLNAVHTDRLIKTALTRSPEIAALLQNFQKHLDALSGNNSAGSAEPPGSGRKQEQD